MKKVIIFLFLSLSIQATCIESLRFMLNQSQVGMKMWQSAARETGQLMLHIMLGTKIASKKYFSEIIKTKGVRFFLKESNTTPEKKTLVFFTKFNESAGLNLFNFYQYPSIKISKYFFKESYTFNPIGGTIHLLVDAPLHKFLNKKLTDLITFPLSLLAFTSAFAWTEDKIGELFISSLFTDKADNLIDTDFDYRELKEAIKEGKISRLEARKTVAKYLIIKRDYHRLLNSSTSSEELLNHAFFIDLKTIYLTSIKEAIPKNAEDEYLFLEGFNNDVNPLQILTLIQIRKENLALKDFIRNILLHPDSLEKNQRYYSLLSQIEQNDFYKTVMSLKVPLAKKNYLLQEDLFYQESFKVNEVLHIATRKRDDKNQLTDIPLTLKDIRDETISSLMQENQKVEN